MSVLDRKRGALLGLAIGDALGAAVEFQGRGSFEPVTGYRGGGPHSSCGPGDWTDDTSMALALADSLSKGWSLFDQLLRYCNWMEQGEYTIPGHCFDIGNTTQRALFQFIQSGNVFSGSTDEQDSGNGSIMRLAPIPIKFAGLFPDDQQVLLSLAADSSRTTHGSKSCVSACQYMSLIMAAFINGVKCPPWVDPVDWVLNGNWPPAKQMLKDNPDFSPEIAKLVNAHGFSNGYHGKNEDTIRGSGYVVESLEAALWSFVSTSSFEDAVLKAVNLGDDADTTGAVCGQIAGSFYGESGIPKQFLEGLNGKPMIEKALEGITGRNYSHE